MKKIVSLRLITLNQWIYQNMLHNKIILKIRLFKLLLRILQNLHLKLIRDKHLRVVNPDDNLSMLAYKLNELNLIF